ncbi:MAG TPA: sigma-70 family RNA polymerase sigma factor [Gemmataceae bacterium]|nr:sigma-70 family RNA polymerase sigma factor [Gemmataceae bacterium]
MANHPRDSILTNLRALLAPDVPARVTDGDLLTRFVTSRDDAAFAALVRRHSGMVLSVCRRVLRNQHDVEDAFQATFIKLVEKAAAIRKRNSVGSWLHGAAYRIASDLRVRLARRQASPLTIDVEAPHGEDARAQLWHEIHTALDQELAKLPERFRAPLVLCYLEGRTRDEAALRLGWSVGVVRGRLERGRQLLRKGLRRRGIALPAALLGTGLTEVGASAAPAYLLIRTVSTALQFRNGAGLAASGLSEPVIELLNQGKIAMLFTKKKMLLFAVVVIGLLGGVAMYPQVKNSSPEVAWAEDQPLQSLPAEAKVELTGRVVGPDGKPAAGARVAVFTPEKSSFGDGKPLATTAADGIFKFSVPRSELALHLGEQNTGAQVVATADGYGLAWRSVAAFLPKEEQSGTQRFLNLFRGGNEPILRLVADDAPLSGQIKTQDGKPVGGVRIAVQWLGGNDKEDLGPWLAAVARNESYVQATYAHMNRNLAGSGMARFAATTDKDGRFRLTGIGRGRLAHLLISGSNAAYSYILVRTAPGEKVNVNGLSQAFCSPNAQGCFGNEIQLTVPPSRPIEGVVKDAETGKPVAGALIQSYKLAGSNTIGDDLLSTQTDASGRFRLEGMPVGGKSLLTVRGPTDQPYLAAVVEVDTSAGKGPVKTDIEVRRGVWVEGQVTEAKTGRPLAAKIDVVYPDNNPNLAQYRNHTMFLPGKLHRTDGSGRFRVPAIPGRAAVAAMLCGTGGWQMSKRDTIQAGKSYRALSDDIEIEGITEIQSMRTYYLNVRPFAFQPHQYHQIRSLVIPAEAKTVQCDLKIE